MLENLLYEKKGAIAYVTLNRPKVLNALNQRTWEDLRAAFEDGRDDAEVPAVRRIAGQRNDARALVRKTAVPQITGDPIAQLQAVSRSLVHFVLCARAPHLFTASGAHPGRSRSRVALARAQGCRAPVAARSRSRRRSAATFRVGNICHQNCVPVDGA